VPGVHKTEASENASLQLLGTYLLSEYSTETAHVVGTNASITRTHQVLKALCLVRLLCPRDGGYRCELDKDQTHSDSASFGISRSLVQYQPLSIRASGFTPRE
jgi:hypothetical protein